MSSSDEQGRSLKKKRPYRLRKRAAQQEETRRRIVEATVDLHSTVGPARTTVSQIAERAGVQRNTFYAHFPEEMDLFHACSGLALERDPLPDPESWLEITAGGQRVAAGIGALYRWYARNHSMVAAVMRDAEIHPPTREIIGLRFGPFFVRAGEVLGEGLSDSGQLLLAVAIDFPTYRTLAQEISPEAAAALMADAVAGTGRLSAR